MGDNTLRITVEFKDLKTIIEGKPEEVFKAFSSFISKAIPTFAMASSLLYTLDLPELAEVLTETILFTSDGRILLKTSKTAVKDDITLTLAGAYVGEKLGVLPSASLTSDQISGVIGKAVKTVRNELPSLVQIGIVERVDRGKYWITQTGLIEVKENIIPRVTELRQK